MILTLEAILRHTCVVYMFSIKTFFISYYFIDGNDKDSTSNTNKPSAKHIVETENTPAKSIAWERKSSWDDTKLSKFRNYKI